MILLFESNIRGGINRSLGDRYVKSDENKKIFYVDANNLYGWAMGESLPFDENKIWHGHTDLYMNKLEEIFFTPDNSDIGFFLEIDSSCSDNIKEKTKKNPFFPEKKVIHKDKYIEYLKKMKPKNVTKTKK